MKVLSLPPGIILVSESPCRELRAETVDHFLDFLSPISSKLAMRAPFKSLLFRGHAESSWKLIPASRRKHEWPPKGSRRETPDVWYNRLQFEVTSLLQFCRNADRQGLAIPQLSLVLDQLEVLLYCFREGDQAMMDWPPSEAISALALAQHYGLPTCLLDFSWNPYVAAYFAARGVMDQSASEQRCKQDPTIKMKSGKSLCIWVIDDDSLTLYRRSENHNVKLLVPPASDNRTLQAQEGVFLWAPFEGIPNRLTPYTEDEQALDSILSKPTSGCHAFKLCLAQELAPRLLNRLVRLGYDGVRLFPSYEGAVKAIGDHAWSGIGHRRR